jgi:hypothetical protein
MVVSEQNAQVQERRREKKIVTESSTDSDVELDWRPIGGCGRRGNWWKGEGSLALEVCHWNCWWLTLSCIVVSEKG